MGNIGYFDSNTVEPSTGFDALEPGDYTMAILESEVKDNKKGTGKYIAVTWSVLEGKGKGRKVWQYINFLNASAVAQQIGQAELSAICRAVGKPGIKDTAELHNIPMRVRLGSEDDDRGGKRNVIKQVLWKETAKAAPVAAVALAEIDDDAVPF
jgi:hypothetical protein